MKTKVSLLALALAGLMFTSCEKSESYLNIEDIKGSATVEGVVFWNQGQRLMDGLVVEIQEPLADATVLVSIPYEEFQENSQGKKVYTTTTDANGKYSIQLPVGLNDMNAEVSVQPFKGTYNKYDKMDGESTIDALYKTDAQGITLKDKDIIWQDVTMTAEEANNTDRNAKLSITGTIKKVAEIGKAEAGRVLEVVAGAEPASGVTAFVTISNSDYEGETLTYIVKTKTDGTFNINATIFNKWEFNGKTKCVVETKPYLGSMEHYYYKYIDGEKKWMSQDVSGLYRAAMSAPAFLSSDYKLIPLALPEVVIGFEPLSTCDIKGIGNEMDDEENYRYNNPFGWDSCN